MTERLNLAGFVVNHLLGDYRGRAWTSARMYDHPRKR
jgi:hypothetical protein